MYVCIELEQSLRNREWTRKELEQSLCDCEWTVMELEQSPCDREWTVVKIFGRLPWSLALFPGSPLGTRLPGAYSITNTTSSSLLPNLASILGSVKSQWPLVPLAAVFEVWSTFPFAIKHIFPCSFGNKRMRLLTRVYGIRTFMSWFGGAHS